MKDFSIDEMRLDREWNQQAARYFEVATELADARREYDELEAGLKVLKAEIDLDVRKNPDKYGLDKTTEGIVSSVVTKDSRVTIAHDEVRDARHRVDILSGALEALQHRKRALEKLVDLHLSGYYAAPTTDAKSQEEINDMQHKVVRRRAGVRKEK